MEERGWTRIGHTLRDWWLNDWFPFFSLAAVLTLGDNQYFCGGYRAYLRSYEPTWGRLKDLTHPTPGDHDYIIHSNPNGSHDTCGCPDATAG